MNPYNHLDVSACRAEIARLEGIDPTNPYEGLAGRTVGESLELAEAWLATLEDEKE